jgi:indolepyruvate ferredoxin oxidoreductase, beta subunit
MKCDIVLAGVGGQGTLSIATVLGFAALENKLHLKQAETHGMSQRGGAVQSYLRLSDKPVHSDLIPMGMADLILSVEPMESLRYLPYLSQEGYIVTSSVPYTNIPNYPDIQLILKEIRKQPKAILIDAEQVARETGNVKSSNMVMLGAATPFIDISIKSIEKGIREIFIRKGEEVVRMNLNALHAGRDYALAVV